MNKNNSKVYFQAFYQGNRLLYVIVMILNILFSVLLLMFSSCLGNLMDIASSGTISELLQCCITLAIFLVLSFIEQTLVGTLRSLFLKKAIKQYKETAFQQLTKKSISAFSKENTGRYLSVLTNDTTIIGENYLGSSFDLVLYCCMFVATLAVLLWYNVPLTLLALVLCLLPLLVMMLMGSKLSKREEKLSQQNERFVSTLQDLLKGFSVIKSFKAEERIQKLFNKENEELEEARFQRSWYEKFLKASAMCTSLLMQCGTMIASVVLAIQGKITIGTVIIFINNCNYLMQPIQMVPQLLANRKAAKALIEKLANVTQENVREVIGETATSFVSEIKLQNVSFGYSVDSKPVLNNVTMEFTPGKKYALVGPSGSGKSTLLRLLMGSYDNYDGNITLDGRELKEINSDNLYDTMSLIDQDVFLFNDTIRNNITMFGDFPKEKVDRAIEQAGLSELLKERGEDYLCGENGVGLSGGERQRISIARTLLRGTPVLLVDEATAALDNKTASSVTNSILEIPDITSITVTHRLEESILRQYDQIFVLKDGVLSEQGTYQDLMEKKGLLYSLYILANG